MEQKKCASCNCTFSLVLHFLTPFLFFVFFSSMHRALANHDILSCILPYIYEPYIHGATDIDDIRNIASLATVCRRWLRAMFPRAFRVQVLQRMYPFGHFDHSCHTQHRFLWVTNASSMLKIAVQELRIVVPDECRCRGYLAAAIVNLGITWSLSRIQRLVLLGRGHLTAGTLSSVADDVSLVAMRLARSMANVRQFEYVVDYDGYVGNPQDNYLFAISGFVRILHRLLMPRLTWVQCHRLHPATRYWEMSDSLTCLDIDFECLQKRHGSVVIPTACLQRLILTGIDAPVPWECFGGGWFPSLRYMELKFVPGDYAPARFPSGILRFLVLEYLRVEHSAHVYLDLYTVFPVDKLTRLVICEPVEAMSLVNPRVICMASSLTILVGGKHRRRRLSSYCISRLFETRCTLIEATLSGIQLPPNILWHDLRRLLIDVSIGCMADITRLIANLPALESLKVTCDSMECRERNLRVPENDMPHVETACSQVGLPWKRTWQGKRIIRLKPDVGESRLKCLEVFAVGGFVSGRVGELAGWLNALVCLGVPGDNLCDFTNICNGSGKSVIVYPI